MMLKDLIQRVRVHTRDFNESIFRREDIVAYLNEGIDRVIQVMPELQNMTYLVEENDVVVIIPKEYAHLLAVYATARLYSQDERHFEASTFMNEFEVKLNEFKEKVENGEIVLIDPSTGEPVSSDIEVDHVVNDYFYPLLSGDDLDVEE